MQSTFPMSRSKFPLFGDWLNIDDFTVPVITSCPASLLLSFISSYPPWLLLSHFSWCWVLISCLLLWHRALYWVPGWLCDTQLTSFLRGIGGVGWGPLFLTHRHKHTDANAQAVSPWAMHRHPCRTYGNKTIQKVDLENTQRHMLSERGSYKRAQRHAGST